MTLSRLSLTGCAAAVVAATLILGACMDGLQVEGKLFDLMGVSGSALDAKRRDPKLADRAPLVVPPDTKRLPEPGSGKSPDTNLAALKDPEQTKLANAKERERLHLAYCRGEIQWKERAFDYESGANRSPFGPCPSLFSGATDKQTK
ncbi:MAG TPA: hypothetical protein VG758_27565 [Hyphomicrobiaceae bacterium]|jgi:hypothetical protein|nr:hypothetical protein [Hyphomicrobiaceae bacterium]